jgi:hypothetical protein
MTLNVPYPAFSAGAAIVATQMNSNFSVIQTYINTQVLGAAGGTITGAVTVSNNLTVTGVASLGASNQVYISPTEEVTGLAAGADITTNDAASFLNARNYPVGSNPAEPYASNRHRFTKYDTTAGEGNPSPVSRPDSQYRLVVNGSIAIRGDIIGYTNQNTNATPGQGYSLGEGTRIETQWLNVRANLDVGGEVRIQTAYDYARLYMGNDYSTNQDWMEWRDNLTGSNLPGFQFVHNDNVHLQISESGAVGYEKLDLRAYKASGSNIGGWPTLSGTTAVITTSGTEQLGISSSSIRFKEDVEDLEVEATWLKINALRPRTFNWNEEVATSSGLDYETQIPELGFIAEEVAEAAPEATLYDADGDPIVYREKSMLSLLVKAVQDLDERVEALG